MDNGNIDSVFEKNPAKEKVRESTGQIVNTGYSVCVPVRTRARDCSGENSTMCRNWLCNVCWLQRPKHLKKCVCLRFEDRCLWISTGALFCWAFVKTCCLFLMEQPLMPSSWDPTVSPTHSAHSYSPLKTQLGGHLLQEALSRAPPAPQSRWGPLLWSLLGPRITRSCPLFQPLE